MRSSTTILIVSSTLAIIGCREERIRTFPKAARQGKNTMGCLVGGKSWKPYESPKLGGSNPFVVYWRIANKRIQLTMLFTRDQQPGKTKSSVYFYLPNVIGKATYTLDQPAYPVIVAINPAYGHYIDNSSYPAMHYLTGPSATGKIIITRFDTTAHIVSGIFNFTGQSFSGATKNISKGHFDMYMEQRY